MQLSFMLCPSPKHFRLSRLVRTVAVVIFLIGNLNQAQAQTYAWQNIRFEYPKPWVMLTNRTVEGKRLVHLLHQSRVSYPVSVVLSFIPKHRNLDGQALTLRQQQSPHMVAADVVWPVIQRFSKLDDKAKLLVSANTVSVAGKLVPGAMLLAPTPQSRIFVSAQTFYVNAAKHHIIGMVVARTDEGQPRRAAIYGNTMNQAYHMLHHMRILDSGNATTH